MAFEGKTLESIEAADMLALHENAVAEGKTLEYKRDLPGGVDEQKREFLADVSSLANAAGGHLVFGIEESEGVPASVLGIEGIDPDAETLRLENIIRDGISPRILGVGIRMVPVSNGKLVPLIRVPRSWSGPHMVTFKNLSRFFSRTSAGKCQLDVSEIRSAFVSSESASQSLRNFRLQRVSDLVSGQSPVALPESGIIVLHSIPMAAAGDLSNPIYDLANLTATEVCSLRTISGQVMDCRPNFDGIVGVGSPDPTEDYVQVFRSGAVEIADASILEEQQVTPRYIRSGAVEIADASILEEQQVTPRYIRAGQMPQPLPHTKWIRHIAFEEGVIQALQTTVQFQTQIGVEPPLLVSLSLVKVSGYRIYLENVFRPNLGHQIDRDVLLFPEILIETLPQVDLPALLKPTFDMVWNAAGYPRSLNYDAQGNRRPRRS